MVSLRDPAIDRETLRLALAGLIAASVVFAGLTGWPAPAAAQSEDGPKPPTTDQELSDEKQKTFDKLVKEGKRHFAQNNYTEALQKFEKAYDIKRSSNLLFNMGLVAEKSGDLETALDYYKTFVVSPNVSLDLRDKAQKRIKVIEPIVEDQREDEKKAEETPDDEPESLAETEEGQSGSGDSTAGTDTGESTEGGSGVGGLLLTGGGVAAIGGGVVFTLLSEQAKNTFEAASSVDARRSAQQSAYVNQWIGSGLLVAGVGAATGGLIMLLSQNGGDSGDASKAALRPAVGPNFTGVQFRTNF